VCYFVAFPFLLQFARFIVSCAFFTTFIFYPVCFVIGPLATRPSTITDTMWPVINNLFIRLVVAQISTIVFKMVAKAFLPLQTPAPAAN
jgi:hypothetical protein